MSSNVSSTSTTVQVANSDLFVVYYPFTIIIVGTLFNTFTLFILCRSIFRDTQRRPTIHYMRVMAIFDTLMLYGWNLDHYLSYAHGFTLQTYSVPFCKIFTFLDYFIPQVSAWIRVFICVDRYLSLSRLYKTWFSKSKSVLIIITCILIVFTLINLHVVIFACFYDSDGTLDLNAYLYILYPMWDVVNLGLYNIAPFVLMSVFNTGVIYHLIRMRHTSTIKSSQINHHAISITLVITTFLFLIMTTPATISFGFFSDTAPTVILRSFDYGLYTYHILSLPLYLITFTEFRGEVIRFLLCARCRQAQSTPTATKVTSDQLK